MSGCRFGCEGRVLAKDLCFKHYYRFYRHQLGEDEFWHQVTKTRGCWYWSGATRRGYARVMILDTETGEVGHHWAGQWIYEKLNGSIGDMRLFLICRNKVCVNPAHMTVIGGCGKRVIVQRMR